MSCRGCGYDCGCASPSKPVGAFWLQTSRLPGRRQIAAEGQGAWSVDRAWLAISNASDISQQISLYVAISPYPRPPYPAPDIAKKALQGRAERGFTVAQYHQRKVLSREVQPR
eukprot:6047635-Prymnesium_polylepis.1